MTAHAVSIGVRSGSCDLVVPHGQPRYLEYAAVSKQSVYVRGPHDGITVKRAILEVVSLGLQNYGRTLKKQLALSRRGDEDRRRLARRDRQPRNPDCCDWHTV